MNIGAYNTKSGKNSNRNSKPDKSSLQIPSDNDSLNLSISVMSKWVNKINDDNVIFHTKIAWKIT